MNINDFEIGQTIYIVDTTIKKEESRLKKCSIIGIFNEDSPFIKVKHINGDKYPLGVYETKLGSDLTVRGFTEREEAIEFRNKLVQKEIERLTKLIIKL